MDASEDSLYEVRVAVIRPADCWPSTLKRLIHLPGAFGILAMQIHGCRGDGRMAQVVPDGRQLGASRQRMGGMCVPHPMGACPAKLFCR